MRAGLFLCCFVQKEKIALAKVVSVKSAEFGNFYFI